MTHVALLAGLTRSGPVVADRRALVSSCPPAGSLSDVGLSLARGGQGVGEGPQPVQGPLVDAARAAGQDLLDGLVGRGSQATSGCSLAGGGRPGGSPAAWRARGRRRLRTSRRRPGPPRWARPRPRARRDRARGDRPSRRPAAPWSRRWLPHLPSYSTTSNPLQKIRLRGRDLRGYAFHIRGVEQHGDADRAGPKTGFKPFRKSSSWEWRLHSRSSNSMSRVCCSGWAGCWVYENPHCGSTGRQQTAHPNPTALGRAPSPARCRHGPLTWSL